jgi:molybdate transport system permease protein
VAIFFHVPLGTLLHQLTNPVVTDALIVSLKSVFIAQVVILGFGTPTAWFLASRHFRGRSLAITLIEMPIVLPPAVAGIGLIVAFGRFGLLGSTFDWLGINVSFNLAAVVLAVTLVAGPFYVRQAISSFEAVDGNMIAASRTLGAGSLRTFLRVTLPLARGGLLTGESLCLARGLGEFGATILFAGSLQGRTQTLPLAVYNMFEAVQLTTALAISALLVILSLAILLFLKLGVIWQPSRQSSLSLFGRSG